MYPSFFDNLRVHVVLGLLHFDYVSIAGRRWRDGQNIGTHLAQNCRNGKDSKIFSLGLSRQLDHVPPQVRLRIEVVSPRSTFLVFNKRLMSANMQGHGLTVAACWPTQRDVIHFSLRIRLAPSSS